MVQVHLGLLSVKPRRRRSQIGTCTWLPLHMNARQLIPGRQRKVLTPWCIAVLFMQGETSFLYKNFFCIRTSSRPYHYHWNPYSWKDGSILTWDPQCLTVAESLVYNQLADLGLPDLSVQLRTLWCKVNMYRSSQMEILPTCTQRPGPGATFSNKENV